MLVAWINFAAFLLGALYLGGDAQNGHIAGTHFFLCRYEGGQCHEVPAAVWHWIYWQAIAAILSTSMLIVECLIFRVRRDSPQGAGR